MEESENQEFERVLTRLSLINDDNRLEQVLNSLLPKLIERFELKKTNKVLIEIFGHVTRWTKSPSKCKLPICQLAEVIKTKCTKESSALRVALLFIEIGLDKTETVEERITCCSTLLDCLDKFEESQNKLISFISPLLLKFNREEVIMKHIDWFLDLFLDCCYPIDFFKNTWRGSRLSTPNFGKQMRSMEDDYDRTSMCLTILLSLVNDPKWRSHCFIQTYICSVLCSTSNRDTIKLQGEEGMRLLRDEKIDKLDDMLHALFDLILGERKENNVNPRLKAPSNVRIKAISSITRFGGPTIGTMDRFIKTVLAGFFGNEETTSVRIVTLQLLEKSALIFPQGTPTEDFIFNALKQQVTFASQVSSEQRTALFQAMSSWISSRNKVICDPTLVVKIATILSQETDSDSANAEYQVLLSLGEELTAPDAELLLSSDFILDCVEFSSKNFKLKSFALELAKKVFSSETGNIHEQNLIHALWITILSTRSFESRETRDIANKLLSDFSTTISFEFLLGFIDAREKIWGDDPPAEYFFPSALRFLKTRLNDIHSKVSLEDFLKKRLKSSLESDNIESVALGAQCLEILLTKGLLTISEIDYLFSTSPFLWFSKTLSSPNDILRKSGAELTRFFYIRWPDEIQQLITNRVKSVSFYECHGSLCACGEVVDLKTILCQFLLSGEEKNTNNKSLRNTGYSSLSKLIDGSPNKDILGDLIEPFIKKCRELIRNKIPDDDLQGPVFFLGSISRYHEDAFNMLLSLLSDSRFGVGSQIAIGKSLSHLDNKIEQILKQILKTIFEESSLKTRSSAAIILEQVISKNKIIPENMIEDLQDGLISLLGEAEENVRMSSCRALSKLFFNSRTKDKLVTLLVRRLSVSSSNEPSSAQRQRRGNEERFWVFQDLCIAAQQSGNASLFFYFIAIAADGEIEEVNFVQALKTISLGRIAVQFIRRRHFNTDEIGYKVATKIWDVFLKHANIYENQQVSSLVWNECSRLLRDSFLARERRSACLTLCELSTKCPDNDLDSFVNLEDAWKDVYRALDDLDESISNGPAVAFGRAMKRKTLIALTTSERNEEISALFKFLLDRGLSHSVRQARDLTRGFLVDAILQKRLPDDFVVSVVESLLRTIGESESMALQYAQLHARGNGGTGEFNIDASKLEELRANLALETPEYAATLKCISRLDQVSVCKDVVTCVGRIIRTGVGLATLVSAVSIASFMASDEWSFSKSVLTGDDTLLTSLALKFASDPSFELKKRILATAASLCRLAGRKSIESYCQTISKAYDEDPETSTAARLLSAKACCELTKRNVLEDILLRPAFLGRFDEEKEVADMWKVAWDAGFSSLRREEELISLCADAINGYSYRSRKQGAECLIRLSPWVIAQASTQQVALDMLKLSLSSATWEGKEMVCKATGIVFSFCQETDIVDYACIELETALMTSNVNRPKWIWEALFEATRKIFSNKLVSIQSRERFLQKFFGSFNSLPREPLVLAAELNCLSSVLIPEISVDISRSICKLVTETGLSPESSWNVKVAALGVLKVSCSILQTEMISIVGSKTLETLLMEEKKPVILLPLLELVKELGKVACNLHNFQASLTRLEGNADPKIGKLAHEILEQLKS